MSSEVRATRLLACRVTDTVTEPKTFEASLYLAEHHPAQLEQLELSHSDIGTRFRVKVAGAFTSKGSTSLMELT
jgi:hypothetical protein